MPKNVEILAADTVKAYVECFGSQEDLFDIVVIDGLYRFDCARQAPAYLKSAGMIILDNSDWHPESARFLRQRDLIEVDFTGFKPTHEDVQTTSVFLHPAFRPKLLFDVQPLSGIGDSDSVRPLPMVHLVRQHAARNLARLTEHLLDERTRGLDDWLRYSKGAA